MASNIAVKITAETADLQANVALARSAVKSFSQELQQLANQATKGGMTDAIKQQMQQTATSLLAAKSSLGEMNAKLTENQGIMARAREGFTSMNEAVAGFGLALGAVQIVEFGKRVFEMAAELQHQAEALGVSTDQLQAFQYAARASGVATDTANAALTKFYSGLGLAAEGTGPALRALQDLKLNVGQLANDQENASAIVARALLSESNQFERNAHIRELFGRGGQDINAMLLKLAQGFDTNLEAAKRNGEYLGGDATEAAHKASIQFDQASTQLKVSFTPAVVGLSHSLVGLAWIARDIVGVMPAVGHVFVEAGNTALQAIPLFGPVLQTMELLIQKKNQLAAGSGKTFEEAKPYRVPPSGEQVDVQGLNALDGKLRERRVLLQEITIAERTLKEAKEAGDKAGQADATTVLQDLHKQLDGLNKVSFGGGFKDAGAKAIAEAKAAISEINADQTKGDTERRAEIQAVYSDLLKSSKLNAAQLLQVEKEKNDAIAQANRQAATEKRQMDQFTAQVEQRIAEAGFAQQRAAIEADIAAGRISRQAGLAQLLEITNQETQIRLDAIAKAEQGYAADTTFFREKELEKKVIVAEMETQKAQIRRQIEQASAEETSKTWKRASQEIMSAEQTFTQQLFSGRVGVLGALEAAGQQFVQREIEQTLRGMTERMLLSKEELTQDQTLGQLGVLMHWLFEGQKTAATTVGETTRVAVKESARAAGSAADVAAGSASIINDAYKSAAGAYSAVVGIPIVGPILAPIAAGTAFAAVAAFNSLTSLDTGTNYIPRDMPVMIHEGERVVPKADNSAMIAALQGGSANDRSGPIEFHYHPPAGVPTNHTDNARDMVRIFEHARRTGRLKTK